VGGPGGPSSSSWESLLLLLAPRSLFRSFTFVLYSILVNVKELLSSCGRTNGTHPVYISFFYRFIMTGRYYASTWSSGIIMSGAIDRSSAISSSWPESWPWLSEYSLSSVWSSSVSCSMGPSGSSRFINLGCFPPSGLWLSCFMCTAGSSSGDLLNRRHARTCCVRLWVENLRKRSPGVCRDIYFIKRDRRSDIFFLATRLTGE